MYSVLGAVPRDAHDRVLLEDHQLTEKTHCRKLVGCPVQGERCHLVHSKEFTEAWCSQCKGYVGRTVVQGSALTSDSGAKPCGQTSQTLESVSCQELDMSGISGSYTETLPTNNTMNVQTNWYCIEKKAIYRFCIS